MNETDDFEMRNEKDSKKFYKVLCEDPESKVMLNEVTAPETGK